MFCLSRSIVGICILSLLYISNYSFIGALLAGPFWGVLADKYHIHRTIIILTNILSCLTMAGQPFISIKYGNPYTNRCPYSPLSADPATTMSTMIVNSSTGLTGDQSAPNPPELSYANYNNFSNTMATPNPTTPESSTYIYEPYGTLFYIILLMQLATSFFNGSSTSFIDIAVMRKSQIAAHHRPVNYGRQRFMGGLGVIIGITVMNYSFDMFPTAEITCYTFIFPIYVLLTVSYIVSAMFLYKGLSFLENKNTIAGEEFDKDAPLVIGDQNELSSIGRDTYSSKQTTNKKDALLTKDKLSISEDSFSQQQHQEQQRPTSKDSYRKTLRSTLLQFDTVFFYITVFIVGYINAPFFIFIYVPLKELNATTAVFTLSFVISASTALFGFFFSSRIIKLLGGSLRTMLCTILVFVTRGFAVSMVPNAWLVLPFQALHFCSFVLFMAACIEHLREQTPLVVMSTLVSLYRSIFEALATVVSSITGGMVMEQYGSRKMFMYYGCVAAVWGVIFGVYVLKKECSTRHTVVEEEDKNVEMNDEEKLLHSL